MKITILGAGAFGTALGKILTDKNHTINYYDPKYNNGALSETLRGADIMVLAVPSEAVEQLLLYLPKNIPLVIATKGLLNEKILQPFSDYAIISGPGFAKDIKSQKMTRLTSTANWAADLFTTDYLNFDVTDDKKGVLMCGALKNVYAILAGLKNLQPGSKEHDIFLDKASEEIKLILAKNGADPKTFDLACGMDDLKITCNFPSRNYEFGQKLRTNFDCCPEKTVEGISTLKRIRRGEINVPTEAAFLRELIGLEGSWA